MDQGIIHLRAISKNIINNCNYLITFNGESLKMFKIQNSKVLKYTIHIKLSATVGWITGTNKMKLCLLGIIIHINQKQKKFYSNDENTLLKQYQLYDRLKNLLSCRISFYDFYDLFDVKEQIGKGSSCKVVRAYDKYEQRYCAIKIIDKIQLTPINYASLEQEIQILLKLKGKQNIVEIYEVYQSQHSYFIVMQLLEGLSLSYYIDQSKNQKSRRLNLKKIHIIMKALFETINILHQNNIIHRDIKPENLMLAEQDNFETLTIIDFGLSTFKSVNRFLLYRCGTPGYVAPEILNNQQKQLYSEECDSFSSGCIFYKLLTGKSAFKGRTFDELLTNNRLCDIDFNFKKDEYLTNDSINLMKGLLKRNPEERVSPKVALQSYFFYNESYFSVNDEDWDQIPLVQKMPMLQICNSRVFQCSPVTSFQSPKFFKSGNCLDIHQSNPNKAFLSPQVSPQRRS